ncbi:MAG: acyltransferase [Burkholderiales bacterium]|nr:acyltransferase [Burkholderiales bacterium]
MNLRQNNNFDVLRFVAASLVLLSHSFPISRGGDGGEPLYVVTNGKQTLGHIAVVIFFVVSGFLIAGSWIGRKKVSSFMFSRVLRIVPGLAVMLLLTVLAGAFVTVDSQAYPLSAVTYFFRNVLLFKGQGDLAGVFVDNPYGSVVNGSLWTLRIEFSCYLVVATLGACGRLDRFWTWVTWAVVLLLSMKSGMPTSFLRELLPLLVWFLGGVLAYLYRDILVPKQFGWIGAGIIICFLVLGIDLIYISPLLSFAIIYLAYKDGPLVNFGKNGDFSYGIYIYAFPVQQFLASKFYGLEWWGNVLIGFPITLLLAMLSWHFVEKKSLRLKSVLLAGRIGK